QDTFELTINGTTVASVQADPNGLSCTCSPTIGTYTVPIGTALPLLTTGVNQFGVHKTTGLPFANNTTVAWAYATVTTPDGPQRVKIFDFNGGDDYDNPDLCGSQHNSFNTVDAEGASTYLCDDLVTKSWSGTLPCSLDVSGLANQNYA